MTGTNKQYQGLLQYREKSWLFKNFFDSELGVMEEQQLCGELEEDQDIMLEALLDSETGPSHQSAHQLLLSPPPGLLSLCV